jgi:hypothetical protein
MLHPMGLWEISLYSLKLYIRNVIVLVMLALMLFTPMFLTGVLGVTVHPIFLIATVLAYFIAICAMFACATLVVSLDLRGYKAGIRQILHGVFGKLIVQVVLTTLLFSVFVVIANLLITLPPALFVSWAGLHEAVALPFQLLGLAVMVVLSIYYIFATPIIVLERIPYLGALTRSKELGKDYRWRIAKALGIFYTVVAAGILGLSVLLIVILRLLSIEIALIESLALATALLFGAIAVFPVVLYYDIRIRKEGFAIEPLTA